MKQPQRLFGDLLQILKKQYGPILLSMVLTIITFASIRWGLYLLSNDNYSPELDPWLSFVRYLESPAWRSYRVLGFASDSEQADIFRSFLYFLSSLALPKWSLGQVFSLVCLWVGTLSMASLATKIVRDHVTSKYNNVVFLVSGILYISTLWTAWVFNFNMMPYVTQFGFLPLLLISAFNLLKNWNYKNLLFFAFSSLLLSSTFVIATLFFVDFGILVFFLIFFGYVNKVKIKKIILSTLLFFSLQLFWILPFIQYSISTSNDVIDSYTNRTITANTIDLEKQMMTFVNSARFYTRLLGTVDDPATDSYIFPMSEEFMGYDFYKVVSLLPFILSIIGLLFVLLQKKWKLLPLWFVMLALVILIANQNPPFGFIYTWLQSNFNIFYQVFRWVSSKLGQPYLLLLILTGTIGFISLLDFWNSFVKKRTSKYFTLLILLLLFAPLLFFSEYLLKGDLFTKRATVELPSQYYQLAEYLKDDPDGRIFYAPPANNGYFREYEWGFVGSQFLGYIVPNPVLDMSLAIGSRVGEKGMIEINSDFNSGDKEELVQDLNKYDVKYVLVDRTLIKGRYGHDINWEDLNTYTKEWDLVWSADSLELYTLPQIEQQTVTESIGDSDLKTVSFFKRTIPKEPQIDLLSNEMKGADLDNGYITKEFVYNGIDTRLYSNLNSIDVNSLPTKWKKEGNNITVRPLLPNINNAEIQYIRTFVINENASYYVISNNVYSEKELNEGVHSIIKWGEAKEISYVRDTTLLETDLTSQLANQSASDCSGNDFTILPTIVSENNSKGFVLSGDTDLPCISQKLNLDSQEEYIANIDINWESSEKNHIGLCLYSKLKGDCINADKFFYAKDGIGQVDLIIPKLLKGNDEISVILYALNSGNERANITVKNISMSLSSTLENNSTFVETKKTSPEIITLKNGERYSINIPVIKSDDTYVFNSQDQKNLIWQPSRAEDNTLLYSISSDGGMRQEVYNQYMNQYQKLLKTDPSVQYLWYWEGENLSNIPATLCLTYSGDDKCWVDDMFFQNVKSSYLHIFIPSKTKFDKLEGSYNSISFVSDSINVLESFVVMPIPKEWFEFQYSPIISSEYYEIEASKISNSPHTTLYEYTKQESRNILLTIPQSYSDSWSALALSNKGISILNDEREVAVNGWKQGWDISDIDEYEKIIIFYWPNILSYIGYVVIFVEFFVLGILLFKENKRYGKK